MSRARDLASTGASSVPTSNRNKIINGGFDVWQRGTSIGQSGGAVGSDRWREYTDVGSGTQSKDTTVVVAGVVQQSYKFTVGGSATNWGIFQVIETLNCAQLANQVMTLSFYAQVSSARSINATVQSSTGVDTIWSGSWSDIINTPIAITTTMQRYTVTFTVPSNMKTLKVAFSTGATNFASSSSINITGIQLELGRFATPFEQNPYEETLRACQRYFQYFKTGAKNSPVLTRIHDSYNFYDTNLPYNVLPRAGNASYTINSPSNVIHKPGIRWDTISNISLTRELSYLSLYVNPSVDDGGAQQGLYLYGVDIFHDCEL